MQVFSSHAPTHFLIMIVLLFASYSSSALLGGSRGVKYRIFILCIRRQLIENQQFINVGIIKNHPH